MAVHQLHERPAQGVEKVMSGEAIARIGCISCTSAVYLSATGNPDIRAAFRDDMASIADALEVPVFVRTSPSDAAEFGPEQSRDECASCSMAGRTLAVREYVELITT